MEWKVNRGNVVKICFGQTVADYFEVYTQQGEKLIAYLDFMLLRIEGHTPPEYVSIRLEPREVLGDV